MTWDDYPIVMPGLVPGIHVFGSVCKTWMAGHRRAEATPFFERLRPAMTRWKCPCLHRMRLPCRKRAR